MRNALLELNYLHLYHFFVIASEGQIAAASRRLRVGQPTLSVQLKQLEESLGFRLFDRKRGEALRLTEKGKVIFAYAQEMFRVGEEMLRVSQGLASKERRHLRIGAQDTLPKQIVFRLLELALDGSDCTVSFLEDGAEQLFEGLADHRLDLTLTSCPAPVKKKAAFATRKLKKYPIVICGAPSFANLARGFPGSLEAKPFMYPAEYGRMRSEIEEFFLGHGVALRALGEAQDSELLRLVALAGRALVPLSYLTIAEDLALQRLSVVGELPGLFEELWISSSKRLVRDADVRRLMKSPEL